MGLFALPNGDKSGDLVEAAASNLKLFLHDWKHDRGEMFCSQPHPNDYLLFMALGDIERAIERYKQECDENPNINPSTKTHLLK